MTRYDRRAFLTQTGWVRAAAAAWQASPAALRGRGRQ